MGFFEDVGLADRPDFQFESSLDPDQQQVSSSSAQAILAGLQQGTFQGDPNAPLGSGLTDIQRWLQGQTQSFGQFDTLTAGAIQRGLSGQPSTSAKSEVDTLTAWRKGLYEPGLLALQQDAIPLLKDAFSQQGAGFSSRLLDAGRRLTSDFTSGATSALANMIREDQIRQEGRQERLAEGAANRQVQTIPLALGAGSARLSEAQSLTNALLPFQNFGQNALDRLRASFNEVNPWLTGALNFTGLNNQIAFDNSPQLNVEGQFGMDVLRMGTELGTAALAASDKTLKSNIKYLTTKLPVNLATWTWNELGKTLGLEGPGFGVIAQDVQKTWPELVTKDSQGFLKVFVDKVFDKLLGGLV